MGGRLAGRLGRTPVVRMFLQAGVRLAGKWALQQKLLNRILPACILLLLNKQGNNPGDPGRRGGGAAEAATLPPALPYTPPPAGV